MKLLKSSFLLGCILVCVACNEEVLTDLQSQIDALKSNQIASIEAQVGNINASITALEATDTELKGYIATLQEQQSALAQENSNLAEIIAATKKDLQDSIGTVQADLLAQLEAYKQTVSGQLALIDASTATLTEKDKALETQIAALREYTDSEIQKAKDWASATFVTLEKYNETVALVSTIQQQIAAINTRMDTFQNDLSTLSTQLAGLREDHLKAIQDNATALATAVTSITNAYTEAIATAITTSETSLKNWVATELTAYYTAAQTDAKLEALQAEQDQKLNQQKTYVENLLTNLQTVLEGKINANTELINGLQGQINDLSSDAAQLAKSILDNADSIAVNSTKIKENAQAIAQNTSDITLCELLIAANKTLIQENARAIAANDTAILALQGRVTVNEQGISNNVVNIAKNATDIAVNAGLIAANATAISNNTTAIADNAAAISQLQTDLQAAIADLTESYSAAIQTAITTLDGKLTGEIATQISTVNTRIDTEVAAINSAITSLTARVEVCESDIAAIRSDIAAIRADIEALQTTVAALLARIQSISYVPKYSDSKAVMTFTNNGLLAPGFAELTFKIQPASAASALTEVWQTALKVEAVSAETRTAPETVNLPIQSVSSDKGYLTVIVGGTGLSEDFFTETKSVFITLVVSDGNNQRASEYINIIPEKAITIDDATNVTSVSASLSGALGRETADRTTDQVILYYSPEETGISGLISNGYRKELTPAANGSFGVSLQDLDVGEVYYYVAAVKDCGAWLYSPIKTFSTVKYTAAAVDMGLPSGLKWASYNLGASSPEGVGAYFAWGETEPKKNYSWSTYKWCNGSQESLTKYCIEAQYGTVDGKVVLDPEDDAAAVKLGGTWRMPTCDEYRELCDFCDVELVETEGVPQYRRYTSRITGNELIIPVTAYYGSTVTGRYLMDLPNNGVLCWTSSLITSKYSYYPKSIYANTTGGLYTARCGGYNIRPVQDWDWSQIEVTIAANTTSIEQHKAQLNGQLAVDGAFFPNKTVWFLFGKGLSSIEALKSSGDRLDAEIQQDGSFSSSTYEAQALVLDAATTYYYVACVQLGTRTFYGDVKSFTTESYTYSAEAIDMGLSVLWSSMNLGAATSDQDGAFYSWGETEPKTVYAWSTYSMYNNTTSQIIKYNTNSSNGPIDNKETLELEDDAASIKLGSGWRIPTIAEWGELRTNSTRVMTTQNGTTGWLITSKITGNSIFLPASGYRQGSKLDRKGYQGRYWSSNIRDTSPNCGWTEEITSDDMWENMDGRQYGFSIRPVQEVAWNQIVVSPTAEAATEINWYSARLNGQLSLDNIANLQPTVWFLYSESESSFDALVANGAKQQASLTNTVFSAEVSDLKPETTYYYIACAKVGTKTFYGTNVQSFTTSLSSGYAASVNGEAYSSFASAIEAVNNYNNPNEESVKLVLGRDVYGASRFSLDNQYVSIVFDLNGHTLSSQDSVLITVENATVIFTDSGDERGKITTKQQKALLIKEGGNVSIANCTIESTKEEGSSFSEPCVYVNGSGASLMINNGTQINTTKKLTAIRGYTGTVTVNGGEISSGLESEGWYCLVLANTATAEINGGSFYTTGTGNASTCHIAASGASVTVNDGYFYSTARAASAGNTSYGNKMVLKGGYFTGVKSASVAIEEGKAWTELDPKATHFHETIGKSLSYDYQVK